MGWTCATKLGITVLFLHFLYGLFSFMQNISLFKFNLSLLSSIYLSINTPYMIYLAYIQTDKKNLIDL